MLYLPTAYLVALSALAFVLGACVGSFVNCASLRRKTGESALSGRSHCPQCGHVLGPLELVPIVSWLAQRGTCKHCGEKISVRYPATELVLGAAFALGVLKDGFSLTGLTPTTISMLAVFALLLYVSLVDLDERVIPFWPLFAMVAVHVLALVASGLLAGGSDVLARLGFSLASAVAVAVAMLAIVFVADRAFGRESMGGGDIMLFFVAGFVFGWQECLFLIIIACIVGIAGALLTQQRHANEQFRTREIPFGPAIAAAFFVTYLVGGELVQMYAGLF